MVADLKLLLSGPMPHKWPVLALSMTITAVTVWALDHDAHAPPPKRQIIYVESWMADRKDSAIMEQQKKDLAQYEAALQRKQAEFRTTADLFGIEWREEAARNKAQRTAVVEAVNKDLDKRIAEAKAREAAAGSGDAAPR
ncbi:MAG: hypothetical protein ABW184_08730 [Sphingobium sp.]